MLLLVVALLTVFVGSINLRRQKESKKVIHNLYTSFEHTMSNLHVSVLLNPVCDFLKGKKLIVDCTLGLGGHTKALLEQEGENLRIVGFELDTQNLAKAQKNLENFSSQVTYVNSNFSNIKEELQKLGIEKVDGILIDLGLSSPHLDDASYGFSFRFEGELDMRFDKNQKLSAYEVVNHYDLFRLGGIIRDYGEERDFKKISRAIEAARKLAPIKSTTELADIIRKVANPRYVNDSLARVFQAIRIEVNDELEVIKKVLEQSVEVLEKGGLLLVISYHSLEDRIVKHFFKEEEKQCVCPIEIPYCVCHKQPRIKIITKKPVTPDAEELAKNPRSRSAKLRVIEKIK